ncbi:Cytochrome b6-f complex iron-sulfur subunit [Streptomyces tanashiensis]
MGGGTVFTEEKVVVTQPEAGEFKAFSAICTHQGCIVNKVADGTIDCPCHGSKYRIADGSVAAGPAPRPLPAEQIKVSGEEITLANLPGMTPEELVREHTIYSCVMGSRAFGLATEGSDTDVRGVYLAPTPLFWRFDKPPAHVEGPAEQQFSWELERFCQLALRNNPNVLECLHSPVVAHVDDWGRELLSLRSAFRPPGPPDLRPVRGRPAPEARRGRPPVRPPALDTPRIRRGS